ncbi:MAG TPA: hypothetical protein PLG99_01465 [Kaistiaceae bacterium]|nr:hypothetical protein [Kaistiaceae bacterium]
MRASGRSRPTTSPLLAGVYLVVVAAGITISLLMAARLLDILGLREAPPPVERQAAPDGQGTAPAVPDPAPAAAPPALWTEAPVRVDPAGQDYPRREPAPSEPPFPDILAIPRSVDILDNVRFAFAGTTYRIAGITPIDGNEICEAPSGRRWACGIRGRVFLRKVLAGDTFRCRFYPAGSDGERPLDCQVTATTTIAGRILAAGWGAPDADAAPELRDIHAAAVAARLGLWSAD